MENYNDMLNVGGNKMVLGNFVVVLETVKDSTAIREYIRSLPPNQPRRTCSFHSWLPVLSSSRRVSVHSLYPVSLRPNLPVLAHSVSVFS